MEISVKVSPASEGANTVIAVITGNSHGGFAATNSRLRFLGASCHSSVLAGTGTDQPTGCGITSFTINVEKEKTGVIALVADVCQSVGKRTTHRTEACLIPVCWDKGVLEVKHYVPFVSKPDCLGQIIGDDLTVVVGSKRFSTCNKSMFGDDSTQQKMRKLQADGYAIVSDGSLLCRFLVGDATLGEVEKAVIAKPINVAELQEQVVKLQQQKLTLDLELQSSRDFAGKLAAEKADLQGRCKNVEFERNHAKASLDGILRQFGDVLCNRGSHYSPLGWLSRIKVKRALEVLTRAETQHATEVSPFQKAS